MNYWKIIQYNIGEVEDYGAFVNLINRDTSMLATLANAMSTLTKHGNNQCEKDFDSERCLDLEKA